MGIGACIKAVSSIRPPHECFVRHGIVYDDYMNVGRLNEPKQLLFTWGRQWLHRTARALCATEEIIHGLILSRCFDELTLPSAYQTRSLQAISGLLACRCSSSIPGHFTPIHSEFSSCRNLHDDSLLIEEHPAERMNGVGIAIEAEYRGHADVSARRASNGRHSFSDDSSVRFSLPVYPSLARLLLTSPLAVTSPRSHPCSSRLRRNNASVWSRLSTTMALP
mmetsp:Transcript_52038/g.101913  ORF Transcript_52038/g.101913 Transcript_52038/m.101913 type:complete len:222 (+) Transcript_52038:24-689(+)